MVRNRHNPGIVLVAIALLALLASCGARDDRSSSGGAGTTTVGVGSADAASQSASAVDAPAQSGGTDTPADGSGAAPDGAEVASEAVAAPAGTIERDDGSVVWVGGPIEFTKADGADPTDPANQDRITASVWITRANTGGQIYNAERERGPNKAGSPARTLWAIGTTDQIDSLSFRPFRSAVRSPKDVVGKDLVMYLPEEDIYLDVTFLSWSQEKTGGFSYRRSTPVP